MATKVFGIDGHVSGKDFIRRGLCPNCQTVNKMPLIQTSLSVRLFSVPTVKLRKLTVAICPNCFTKLVPSKKALNKSLRSPASLIWHDEFKKYRN